MNSIVNFEMQKDLHFIRQTNNDLRKSVDMLIDGCFDQHGHGAELAADAIQDAYESCENKKLGSLFVSGIIESLLSRGYWHQTMELRKRLEPIRDLHYEQECKKRIYRRAHPNGDAWIDDFGVMHGELIVTI